MPRFENVWSVGNVIQIGVFFVAFAVAWGSAHKRLEQLETAQADMRQGSADWEGRLRAMEISASRSDERIGNLLRSMDELKQQQRETNELLRGMVKP